MPTTNASLGKVIEIGFIVTDIDRCTTLWEQLPGASRFSIYRSIQMVDVRINGVVGQIDIDVAMGCVSGMVVELICQKDDRPSPFRVPSGVTTPIFNHWSYFVADFDDSLARLMDQGLRIVFEAAFVGASRSETSRVAYLAFNSPSDGYIEIMEATPPLRTLYAEILGEDKLAAT